MSAARLRAWVKRRETPLARLAWSCAMSSRTARLPMVPVVHKPLYAARAALLGAWAAFTRAAWWTPLFLSRVETKAPGLRLVGSGMPLVIGPVRLLFGRDVEMVTAVTIAGRTATPVAPVLELGDRASVGWQVTISVGTRIAIGRNARVGNRSFLAGYPGHPYDPDLRAAGAPDTDDQVGDIVLEDDVWLGTGVTVLPGVTIGRGTVVGAGSVVTRDLPRMVLAAGVPARVIRAIDAPKDRGEPA